MSVRIVRTKSGDDVICDLYEVTTKEEPEKPVAFQLNNPYIVYVVDTSDPNLIIEGGISKMTAPEINFTPWAPLSAKRQILLKMDEVVTAYETFNEVIDKYNELVEAVNGGRGSNSGATGGTNSTNGGSNAPTTDQSDTVETKEGVPVGEGDGAGRGAEPVN